MRISKRLNLSVCLLALCACDPTLFADIADQAPTRVLEKPDSYPRTGFGAVIAAYQGDLDGTEVSRIAVTGGAGTPFLVYQGWNGEGVDLGGSLFDGCDDANDCAEGAGASIVGLSTWRVGQPNEGRLCTLVGAPMGGAMLVRCESIGGAPSFANEQFNVVAGFGESGAAIASGHPAGVAVFGSPSTNSLFRVPDGGTPVAIDIPAGAQMGSGLGTSIAAIPMPGNPNAALVAAGGTGQVVVLSIEESGGTVTTTARGCMTGTSGFGAAVALSRNGDLWVGSVGSVGRYPFSMIPADALTDPGNCAEWPGRVEIECGTAVGQATCSGSEFGRAIAVGDINGDGTDEAAIGAPMANVDGVSAAGAVFIVAGDGTAPLRAVHSSAPEANDNLGAPVAMLPNVLSGTVRMEPVAGAPGRNIAAIFLCSGVGGDDPATGARCVPTP